MGEAPLLLSGSQAWHPIKVPYLPSPLQLMPSFLRLLPPMKPHLGKSHHPSDGISGFSFFRLVK